MRSIFLSDFFLPCSLCGFWLVHTYSKVTVRNLAIISLLNKLQNVYTRFETFLIFTDSYMLKWVGEKEQQKKEIWALI